MSHKIVPEVPGFYPVFGNRATRVLGRWMLKTSGWRVEGEFPAHKKLLMAVGPHTSNWDFLVGVSVMLAMGFRTNWLGKHSLFVWPLKTLMRYLGGMPVNRKAAHGVVEQISEQFRQRDVMLLALSPEGTRRPTKKLKTGFLRIASRAEIPIFLVGFDYQRKTVVLSEVFQASGDIDEDEKVLRDYFRRFKGRIPENYCPTAQ